MNVNATHRSVFPGSVFRRMLRLGACLALFVAQSALASPYLGLTIEGAYRPSVIGTLPADADESWLWFQFTGGGRFSWFYGPGSDGGVVFGQPQGHPPYDDGQGGGTLYGTPGQLTSPFVFLNQPSVFYSEGTGLRLDANNRIDMRNLRLFWGETESDVGIGVNGSAWVPQVPDVLALGERESGWSVAGDGRYDLIFHTEWSGAPMAVHFTGSVIAAPPTVAAAWPGTPAPGAFVFVFGSGFLSHRPAQVAIGDVPVSIVQVVNDALLIFMLPSGVTGGPVTVTTPGGSAVSPNRLGESPPGLAVSAVWPATDVRPGQVVFIFGSGFDPTATVHLNGSQIYLVHYQSPEMLLFVVPQEAQSGTLSVQSGGSSVSAPTPLVIVP